MFYIDGIKAFNENNYEIAKDLFLQAINENPEEAQSYLYLGKCYFFCDEKQLAILPLERFIELMQNEVVSVEVASVSVSSQFCAAEDKDMPTQEYCVEATEVPLAEATKFYPLDEKANISNAFDLLGQCYGAENNNTEALRCYKQATTKDPLCVSAWNNMGLLYIKLGLVHLEADLKVSIVYFNDALIFIKKALNTSQNIPMFLHSIASWFEQYVEVLKKVTMKDELARQQNIAQHFSYGIIHYNKALSVCNEQDVVLKNIIGSNLTECLAQYGHHCYKNKDYQTARDLYFQALDRDPQHLIVLNQIGMSFFKEDRFPEARQYFSSILEKTQDNQEIADAWLNIACAYQFETEWKKAEEALNKAETFMPEDESILDQRKELHKSKFKSTLLRICTPQGLFRPSNIDTQGTENKIDEELSFRLG